MTRDEIVEVMARAMERSLAWDVEAGARACEMTCEERRKVATAALAALDQAGLQIVVGWQGIETWPGTDEAATVRFINKLRADEGDCVTILCDNPDFNGQPNCAILCNGEWTDYDDLRFKGDTVLQCLTRACEAKDSWKQREERMSRHD